MGHLWGLGHKTFRSDFEGLSIYFNRFALDNKKHHSPKELAFTNICKSPVERPPAVKKAWSQAGGPTVVRCLAYKLLLSVKTWRAYSTKQLSFKMFPKSTKICIILKFKSCGIAEVLSDSRDKTSIF